MFHVLPIPHPLIIWQAVSCLIHSELRVYVNFISNYLAYNHDVKQSVTSTEKIHKYYIGYIIYIIRQIKSRRMRWAGHVARMGERGKI
jgi:hypothetical protein